ncbi:hypothetical protein [Streptomyces asiaticus]|uniref:hypothetical protein n=1 Tax=Streptomyces asiaticus TaxID=114695 RepID=UPI00380A13F2
MDEAQFLRKLNSALPREKRHPLPPPKRSPDTDAAHTVETLQALSSTAYTQHVIAHLGAEHDDQWALFLDRALIRRTHAALARKRSAALRAEQQPHAEGADADRKRRLHAFFDLIDTRIQQVESLLPGNPVRQQRDTIMKLVSAIRAHHDAATQAGMTPEPWDQRLWAVLRQIDITR